MNLLQLVQAATGEMGLGVPNAVAGNNAADTIQQLYLINGVLRDLLREYQWQGTTIEYRFTTEYHTYTGTTTSGSASVTSMSSIVGLDSTFMVVGTGINQDTYVSSAVGSTVTMSLPATASGTAVSLTFSKTKYAFPADFDRLFDRTQWDKSKHWEMLGPETQQQLQWLKSGYISTGPRIRFYEQQGYFQVWPPTGSNELLGYVYLSNYLVATASGNQPSKSTFTLDSDVCIFADNLMIAGLKNKYFQVKGFGNLYQADYQRELDFMKANDGGSPTLSMAPRPSSVLIGFENIPDSNYGT